MTTSATAPTTLFAALDVEAGTVISQCTLRHRAAELIRSPRLIDKQTPADTIIGEHQHGERLPVSLYSHAPDLLTRMCTVRCNRMLALSQNSVSIAPERARGTFRSHWLQRCGI